MFLPPDVAAAESAAFCSRLQCALKESALKSFLIYNAPFVSSLALEALAHDFELELPALRSFVARMIYHNELYASFDETSSILKYNETEWTRYEYLINNCSDKTKEFLESHPAYSNNLSSNLVKNSNLIRSLHPLL